VFQALDLAAVRFDVRTHTLAGPGGDPAVLRIKETGTNIAVSLDGNARYCSLSPREGVQLLVAECCRNLSAVGAEPVAATNNLNFGNPERPAIMAQLVEAIEGLSDACRHFETPITGGNVSLYNETLGEAIWPTPVIGIVGLMTAAPITIPFKNEGRTVMLLGGLGSSDEVRFGGTQYAKAVLNKMWGLPPALDMHYEKRVHTAIRQVIRAGLAESSHDVGDGGLAVALAESCSSADIGAQVSIATALRPELALFHEGPSRILISTESPEAVEKIASENNIECLRLGVTMKERLRIDYGSKTVVDCPISRLREVWESALEDLLSPVHA